MSGFCGYSLCQRTQKIKEHCPKHKNQLLTHFCANQSCLEMLCAECIKSHQENHQHLGLTGEKLCNLVEIEEYYERITAKELDYEQQRRAKESNQQRNIDPCQILCEYVDEYFYGSTQNKIQNLKARKQLLKTPSTKSFIDIVEKTSHYRIQSHFKEQYFSFLDELLAKTLSH